jgi:hypothetical protein
VCEYGRGDGEWRRWRWGNMVDGLHMHTWNRMMKSLAIALSEAGWSIAGDTWWWWAIQSTIRLLGTATMNTPWIMNIC